MTTATLQLPALYFSSNVTPLSSPSSPMEPKSPGYNALPSDEHQWRAWRAEIYEMIELLVTEPPSSSSTCERGKVEGVKRGADKESRGSKAILRRSSKAIRSYLSRRSQQSTESSRKERNQRFTHIVTDAEFLRGGNGDEQEIYAVNWPSRPPPSYGTITRMFAKAY